MTRGLHLGTIILGEIIQSLFLVRNSSDAYSNKTGGPHVYRSHTRLIRG
jgi:hypothetical protein